MAFGFRRPSWRKSWAARTSFKRYLRHNLGLKAPRGMGILTNPKKAAYNYVYNRTTVPLFPKAKRGKKIITPVVSTGEYVRNPVFIAGNVFITVLAYIPAVIYAVLALAGLYVALKVLMVFVHILHSLR
jgi:hypothetical protein